MDRVLEWLKEQELLAGELHPEVQSIAAITSPFSSHGDPVGSPSDLIDLRSIKPSQSHRKSETNLGHCQIESISTLDLNQPAQHEQNNPLEAQHDHDHDSNAINTMADNFVPPGQQRYTRACMVCSIVMTQAVSHHLSRLTAAPYLWPLLDLLCPLSFTYISHLGMSANGSRPKAIQKRGLPELPVPRAPRQY